MNNSKTSIGYVGTVSIEFPHKSHKTFNNGSKKFFELLNKFISRQTVDVGNLPAYLMVYATSSSTLLETTDANDPLYSSLEILNKKVHLNPSITTTLTGKEVVVFNTVLSPSDMKSGITTEALDSVSLGIISADASTILAATDRTDGVAVLQALGLGFNATVKWQMSFENE